MPKFLTRLLNKFKARHHIRKYRLYGKAKAINLVVVKEKLQEIKKIVNLYINKDIYNINASAVFSKIILNKSGCIKQNARKKHKKA